jgi:mono/diheme cytochrome c family protein
MHQGVSRDGSHLFPVFPYYHFTKLTDADVTALYAYFMTRTPIRATLPLNTLPFPLNIRTLQAVWKLAFFRSGPLLTQPDHSPDWNRGAYLAEGIAHCAACHSPRNALGAEKREQAYAGSVLEGRPVPPLTNANWSPVPWSEDELYSYLRSGSGQYHGQAGGAMASVIRDGLVKLPDSDIKALAVYFADIGGTAARVSEAKVAIERAETADHRDLALKTDAGARLYTAACASCHYNSAGTANPERPSIALMSAINAPEPTDLVRTILNGRRAEMPAFGTGLGDAEIALIVAHLRRSRTSATPWPDLERKVSAIRALTNTGELVK